MEHLVSRHVIAATGEGWKVICYRESTRNKSQTRFSWWGDGVNETKTYIERERVRESQQISTDTHATHLGYDDKVRKRNISGGWMRELSQRSGCRVPNVGGSEVGGSFMEPRDHSASELYVLLGERYICGLLHNFFLKEITFQHRWEGWALRKLDLFSQMCPYF